MRKRFSQVFLELIREKYRYIVFVTAISTLFAVILSLVLPHTYQATGLFTPVLGAPSPYSSLVENLRFRMLDMLYGSRLTVSDVYTKILRSYRIQSEVIAKCKYQEVNGIEYMCDAIEKFEKNTSIELGFEGFITIQVKDRSPDMAAQMVNEWMYSLDEFLQESQMAGGSREKQFVQEQLLEVRAKLSAYKDSLADFLMNHGFLESIEYVEGEETPGRLEFSLNAQVNTSLSVYYLLLQELMTNELSLSLYSKMGENMPVTQAVRRQRDALKAEIQKFAFVGQNGFGPGFSQPLAVTPAVEVKYRELRRNVNLYSLLEEMLSAYSELYRIMESREISPIEVIDWGRPPQKRIWPSRKRIVIIGFVSSLLISTLVCLSQKYKDIL